MSITPLFRKEVADAKKAAWLGQVQIAQPLPVTFVAIMSVALIASTMAYAGFATYTRRVHASGALMPSAGLITVASPSAGLITSSAVAEGQQVKEGDLLFIISLDATSTNGPTQERVIEHLKQQKLAVEKARALRLAGAEVEKQSLAEQIEKLKSQGKHLAEQVALQTQAIRPLRDRSQVLQNAVRSGIVRDSEYQYQNYILNQSVTQLGYLEQSLLQLETRISEMGANHALFDTKLAQEINQLDRAILQLDQQITEAQARRAIEVRAPAAGTLTSIRVHPGEQVPAGVPLLTLLPSSSKLYAHFYVDSSAIGFIAKGQPVIMRYAAFPFQRYGLYKGEVTEVTRAPVRGAGTHSTGRDQDEETKAAGGLYRIVVDPELPYVDANGEQKALEAGMKVEADIAIERRRVVSYLFDPLKHLRRSVDLVTGEAAP
jgi:membrane fusion protein